MKCFYRLGIKDLSKMIFSRFAAVNKASAKPVKELNSYAANRLADELYPKEQFLKLEKIREFNKDYKSFVFMPNTEKGTKKIAWFSSGQCISISVDIKGKKYKRPFYITSSPKDALNDGFISLTVDRNNNDIVSNYILDELKQGDEIISSAPFGDFTYEPLRDSEHIVGIANKSGIMPFLSFAKSIYDGNEKCSLTLIYLYSNENGLFLLEELSKVFNKSDKLRLEPIIVDKKNKSIVNGELINKYVPHLQHNSFFICGDSEQFELIENVLLSSGVRKKFIRRSRLTEFSNPENCSDYSANSSAEFKLTIHMEGKQTTISCSAKETLLKAMENAGINPPNLCRIGKCGWCHSQIISGEIYVPKGADFRRMADKEFGYIHPCCSFPLSDIVLDVPV